MLRNWKSYLVLLFTLLFFSCGTLHIEKRVHRKGYHVHWNKRMKSNQEDVKFDVKKEAEDNTYQYEQNEPEENTTFHELENIPIVEPTSKSDDQLPNDKIQKTTNYSAKEKLEPTINDNGNSTPESNETLTAQSGSPGTGLIILGILLLVLGLAVSAFIFLLGGEALGLVGAIGVLLGIVLLLIGFRMKNGMSGIKATPRHGGKINLFALFAWILLPVCFFGVLGIVAGPIILTFLIIATIQFKKYPDKYKWKWMVIVLWILIMAAASMYFTTALLVILVFG